MYACEVCGEEFETLSRLRLDHRPCPVEEEQRRHEEATRRLREEWGLEVGDWCRVIGTGQEVEVVGVDPPEGGEGGGDGEGDPDPRVTWVPAGAEDVPENRQTSPASDLV
jgi:hypothetical protein